MCIRDRPLERANLITLVDARATPAENANSQNSPSSVISRQQAIPPVWQHLECDLNPVKDPNQRDRWARLRFVIIGPLLAAPPPAGELHNALRALAAKTWRHPTSGLDTTFGLSSLQRWYYAARKASCPTKSISTISSRRSRITLTVMCSLLQVSNMASSASSSHHCAPLLKSTAN